MNYVYNASKPIVQYASNKVVEGAGYLYNKISDNIKGTKNNNNGNNNNNNGNEKNEENNIIQLNSDDVQHSSLVFEKAEGIDNVNESEIKIEEYPSLTTINKEIEKKNNNENKDENNDENINENSAAPIEINIVKKDE